MTSDRRKGDADAPGSEKQTERKARLAAALRENLRRRKRQKNEREAAAPPVRDGDGDGGGA